MVISPPKDVAGRLSYGTWRDLVGMGKDKSIKLQLNHETLIKNRLSLSVISAQAGVQVLDRVKM